MRRALLVTLAFLLLYSSAWAIEVTVAEENLRATPNGLKVGTVLQGADLREVEKDGNWVKVELSAWIWAPSVGYEKQTTSEQEQVDWRELDSKYSVVDSDDVSHGAARRITYYVQLKAPCSKEYIREVVKDVTDKYKSNYDIVWTNIITMDAKRRTDGMSGWAPVACESKWISPSLDKQWHTPNDGMGSTDEYVGKIAISWVDFVMNEMCQ